MAIARTLQELGDISRTLYLFDTFEGMNEPTADDMDHHGEAASSRLAAMPKGEGNIWAPRLN